LRSQLYKRVELFINKVADNSRKGVVGNNGIKIPKIPKNIEINPKVARIIFKNLLLACLKGVFTIYSFSL